MICLAANSLWLAGCASDALRFRRATTRVVDEQDALLGRLLRLNANTEFGRRHGFSAIPSVSEYQRRVPVRSYHELQPWIDRVAGGVGNVLTREPVRLFEPTSGSTGSTTANKLVPYTATLQREFQRGIRPWIADLFRHDPALMAGPSYWSITPAGPSRRTSSGIPIGFEDDSCYVGGWQRRLVQAVMAAPSTLRHLSDMERFQYLTLLSLVRCSSLRLISVWNPTFLSVLVGRLPDWSDAIARDLQSGRRAQMQKAMKAATPAERHAALWPYLGLISCWADANAAAPAAEIARLFPQARIQAKGLIATEGFISLPLDGREGGALAIRSHFLEFAPVAADGRNCEGVPFLAHELERGQRYAVILTTGGGLYRYRLHDVVEVLDRVRQCPLIRFIGRQELVSDWVGEKLNDAFVAHVLADASASLSVSPRFAMLACDTALTPPAYVLYIDADAPAGLLIVLAARIDRELRRSFHYDYARRLAQLGPVRVFRAEHAGETYLMSGVRAGQRAGAVKPPALDRRSGWTKVLGGQFVDADMGRIDADGAPRAEDGTWAPA
jgi:hypothetical protein